MKRLFVLPILLLSFLCKAQDTVKVTDSHYLTNLVGTALQFQFTGNIWPAYCNAESFSCPSDSTTVYGVVIPMTDWIWNLGKCPNMPVAICRRLENDYLDTIDTICFDALQKRVYLNTGYLNGHLLEYSNDVSENNFSHGLELYFHHPISTHEFGEYNLPDTFYLAKDRWTRWRHFMENYGSTDCPLWFIEGVYISDCHLSIAFSIDENGFVRNCSVNSSDAIPIVKLRSDPPKGFRLLSRDGNRATVEWRGSYDVESYQLSLGLFGTSPDSGQIVTLPADTADYNSQLTYSFDNLAYGVRHAVWIRKSCRYTTAGYDTLVWGPWSSPAAFYMVGIDDVEADDAFTVSPNPTRGTVMVELRQAERDARLQLLDLQGRLLEEWPVTSDRLTVDISRHPAGSYLLKLTTPSASAVRQLTVAR